MSSTNTIEGPRRFPRTSLRSILEPQLDPLSELFEDFLESVLDSGVDPDDYISGPDSSSENEDDELIEDEDWDFASPNTPAPRQMPSLPSRRLVPRASDDDDDEDEDPLSPEPDEGTNSFVIAHNMTDDNPWDHTEYEIPFGPYLQIDWTFEELHPHRARATAFLENLAGNERAQTIRRQVETTYNNLSERVTHAARVGREVAVVSAQMGRYLAGEALNAGGEMAAAVNQRWPTLQEDLARPIRQRWVRRLGGFLRQGIEALPPLETQLGLARGRRG